MLTPGTAQPVDLSEVVHGSPYQAYTYSYPHKTAYRALQPGVSLDALWKDEDCSALFLYLHIPFCEHRCGFCNLFTQARPEDGLTARYLAQLEVEADIIQGAIGSPTSSVATGTPDVARVQQVAIGGGTPTFLTVDELERLLRLTRSLGVTSDVPLSVEVSPATVDDDKLALLSGVGTDRVSIGIQSFDEAEAGRLGRPQRRGDVLRALEQIRDHEFPILNLDLIYGGEGQSLSQWMRCVREAVTWQPEEVYLYPLYVRPLTGLGRQQRSWDDQRLQAYRAARDHLLAQGYRQTSMRMFTRGAKPQPNDLPAMNAMAVDRAAAPQDSVAPEYHCQTDGMIGLGCGARSYTRDVHYSTEYAVGRRGVRSIIADYLKRDRAALATAQYGIRLTPEDRRRRFVILSLMQADGFSRDAYRIQFGQDALVDLPQLAALPEAGLAQICDQNIQLTATGLERSDAIGPWLYSQRVRHLMQDYELS